MKEKKNTPLKEHVSKLHPLHAAKHTVRKARERFTEHRVTSPHRSFRFTRRSELPRYKKLPAWWRLIARTFRLLKHEWKKVLALIAIFAPVSWIVSGLYSQSFSDVKLALNVLGEGSLGAAEEALVLFTGFFAAQGGISPDSLVILNVLFLLFWLSFVWIARYAYAGKRTSIREAIYTSGAAFVPFLLLLMLLIIQLIPMLFANLLISSMTGTGFSQTSAEIALFATLAVLLIILSLYFIMSTLIALQIVALPGMYPWRALRNARKLIGGQRFSVLRKVVMLTVVVLAVWAITFVPLLLLDNAICAQGTTCWSTTTLLPLAYYALIGLTLAFASTYIYLMYRALLEEGDALV